MDYLIAGRSGQSWTHAFTRPGTFTYFCTIHPWMDGLVTVEGKAQNIPKYPVYASGVKINTLPWYIFTPDGKVEVGLSWDPRVLLTGKCLPSPQVGDLTSGFPTIS